VDASTDRQCHSSSALAAFYPLTAYGAQENRREERHHSRRWRSTFRVTRLFATTGRRSALRRSQFTPGGGAQKIKGERFFKTIADDGWKRFYIKWYGPAGADARALCPYTCSLLDDLPEVHLAMFSILEPGSVISPHSGPFKACLRYHLGLSCPPEAQILVDGIPYSWRDGEDVLFDDNYVHEVVNRSDTEPRIILFCDVERKMTTPTAARLNRAVCRTFGPLTTRSNDRTEKKSQE